MIPEKVLKKIISDLEEYKGTFAKQTVSNPSILKEATKVVREAVRKALSEANFDVSKPFILAVIGKFKVEVDAEQNGFEIVHEFENREIKNEWDTKDGSGESSIDSLDIVKMMDEGRGAYDIEGGANTVHGLIVIPPPGQSYDPENKANKIVGHSVHIPKMAGSDMRARADDALQKWVDSKMAEWVEKFMNDVTGILNNALSGAS